MVMTFWSLMNWNKTELATTLFPLVISQERLYMLDVQQREFLLFACYNDGQVLRTTMERWLTQ